MLVCRGENYFNTVITLVENKLIIYVTSEFYPGALKTSQPNSFHPVDVRTENKIMTKAAIMITTDLVLS